MTISIKWLGHASFEIRADGKMVYCDPYEGDYFEKADLMLVTHSRFDHCDTSEINRVYKPDTVAAALFALHLSRVDKTGGNVKTVKPGEEVSVGNIKVKAVEAYNNTRLKSLGNPFHPKALEVGYLITADGNTVYEAIDTDFISEMMQCGHPDAALLLNGGICTIDNADAAEAAVAINSEVAIPMHRWDKDPEEFKREVEANSKTEDVLLSNGEEYRVV